MKCSKCGFLGFTTSDHCKNCGYDFSLQGLGARDSGAFDHDLPLHSPPVRSAAEGSSARPFARALAREAPNAALPLFVHDDDRPLVTVPVVPRAPLAVRRSPMSTPRVRSLERSEPDEPVLDFCDPPKEVSALDDLSRSVPPSEPESSQSGANDNITARRLFALALDHGILLGIDAAVLYFTLRIAGLSVSEARLVPPLPLLAFLGLLKFAYFVGFTTWGGQTIGKMAAGIRVVADDGRSLDAHDGLRRTLASLTVVCTLGLAYLPGLFGRDRRSLHDRLTGTRVVALPTA